jgi:hypothetical protein
LCSQLRLVDSRKNANVLDDKLNGHAGAVFSMIEGEMLTTKSRWRVAEVSQLSNQRWISISVVDSGCGMEPKSSPICSLNIRKPSKAHPLPFRERGSVCIYVCLLCRQLSGSRVHRRLIVSTFPRWSTCRVTEARRLFASGIQPADRLCCWAKTS